MTQSNSTQNLAVFDNVVTAMAISLDGRQVIAGLGNGELQRLDLVSGKPIGKPFQIDEGEIKAVALSPDGKYIVSAGLKASEGFEAIIRLWNTQGDSIGDPLGEYDGYVVTSVVFSPDSKYPNFRATYAASA
jgi:WD40 repeat protein